MVICVGFSPTLLGRYLGLGFGSSSARTTRLLLYFKYVHYVASIYVYFVTIKNVMFHYIRYFNVLLYRRRKGSVMVVQLLLLVKTVRMFPSLFILVVMTPVC
jgi:hypothetical protein